MTELSTADRQRIWRGLMRYWSAEYAPMSNISKTDLQAAVNAADTWIDNNQTGYNTALPDAFRNNATQAQKTVLFCVVAAMRVNQDFARKLVGEVD